MSRFAINESAIAFISLNTARLRKNVATKTYVLHLALFAKVGLPK